MSFVKSSTNISAEEYVAQLNKKLKTGWSAHLTTEGRICYCNHGTQTASWLPPAENWDSSSSGSLPFGWEPAIDKEGKQYFINHLNKTTTYEDPRKDVVEELPQPREVELIRDPDMGFGFVAGSEKPVIVRFVTDGGPSVEKLLPGDQILKINGEDVKTAPREHVIDLVRSCKHSVLLTVCQPHVNNSTRKSALLSAAKKAKLKNNPSRVRFAEGVLINGSPLLSPSSYYSESCIPLMPNVLKVFLENGQTKSFKYDSSTTVQDVIESLQQKLSIKYIQHFSLVVEHIKSLRRNKLTLLNPKECLARIAARPGAQHLRCLFRVTFVPRDAYELLKDDPISFEYLYMQCCNDMVQERFAPELKYDIALRLAALHIQQHALSNNIQGKLSVKTIERECGLERFVPMSLMETMKHKELRKLLTHFLKLNQNLSAPGQRSLTSLQAKLHYLKIISELPSYGAKCFTTNLRDSNMETVILISPKFGISQIPGLRNSVPLTLAEIEDLSGIVVSREDELSYQVELQVQHPEAENIVLSLEDRDAEELVLLLQGYYQLLTDKELPVHQEKDRWADDSAPSYSTEHKVQSAGWNYPITNSEGNKDPEEHSVDLSTVPIYKPAPPQVLTANGHVPNSCINGNVKRGDATSGMAVAVVRGLVAVDKNMNAMAQDVATKMENLSISSSPCRVIRTDQKMNHNNIENSITGEKQAVTNDRAENKEDGVGFVLRSVVSMEMLEDSRDDEQPKGQENEESELVEAKNVEVIRRVAEMHRIVRSAETYLSGEDTASIASDEMASVVPRKTGGLEQNGDQLPQLKAADSLLLLTQFGGHEADLEAIRRLEIGGGDEPSGSDTDSMSTPTDSPSHRPEQRRVVRPPSGLVGSSFGLHSPDNLPVALQKTSVQDLLRRFQGESQLPYPFAEGTLYLDPDIIDLTMIPPPITPDRERMDLPLAISMPPTPFADRQSLEAELRALEAQLHHETKSLEEDLISGKKSGLLGKESHSGSAVVPHTSSLSFVLPSPSVEVTPGASFDKILSPPPPPPQGWGAGDIDTFIASVTVPPPPPSEPVEPPPIASPIIELTPEDISAYIIPPPPPPSSNADSDAEIISRLHLAAEKVKEVVGKGSSIHSTLPRLTRPANRFVLNLQQSKTVGQAAGRRHVTYLESQLGGESSGYETQTSSIVSYSDGTELSNQHHHHHHHNYPDASVISGRGIFAPIDEYLSKTIGCTVISDDGSVVSGGSSTASGGTEGGGHQGDTEDSNNEDATSSEKTVRQKAYTKGLKHSMSLGDDCASSSESEPDHSRFQPSPLGSDDGRDDNLISPQWKHRGMPRSLTSPQITRKTRDSDFGDDFPRSQSVSSENNTDDFPMTSLSNISLQSMSSENFGDQEQNIHTPTRGGRAILESEDSAHTGTILKSPHTSPSKTNQGMTSVKPPLPPSSDSPRRVIQSKNSRLPMSPTIERKKSLDGSTVIQVPKPVLPKAVVKSPTSTSPKKSANPVNSTGSNSSSASSSPLKTFSSPNSKTSTLRLNSPVQDFSSCALNGLDSSPEGGGISGELIYSVPDSVYSDADILIEHDNPLQKADDLVAIMITRLDEILDKCGKGELSPPNKEKLLSARDTLVIESRRFVTASKLFVKSATESEQKLIRHAGLCVSLLDKMLRVTEILVSNTSTPLQTQNLALKVRDVASTFMQTNRAAAQAIGKPMNDPSMHVLMQHATTLAAVLTSLMRTLRTFNP